jgi:hybrid cluster-associated redox disulfide protein
MNDKKKITKDWTIQEALALGNDAFEVLAKYFGPGCLACGAAAFETLEMGCITHGLPEEKIAELVAELQTVADKAPQSDSKN